jgi:hypothetical protein
VGSRSIPDVSGTVLFGSSAVTPTYHSPERLVAADEKTDSTEAKAFFVVVAVGRGARAAYVSDVNKGNGAAARKEKDHGETIGGSGRS